MIRLTIIYIIILISLQGFSQTGDTVNSEGEKEAAILSSYKLKEVYPNPFGSKINLVFHTSSEEAVKLYLYNIVGQVIHEKEYEISPVNNHVEIKLEHMNLENGMYLLRIEKGKDVETVRLVRK